MQVLCSHLYTTTGLFVYKGLYIFLVSNISQEYSQGEGGGQKFKKKFQMIILIIPFIDEGANFLIYVYEEVRSLVNKRDY